MYDEVVETQSAMFKDFPSKIESKKISADTKEQTVNRIINRKAIQSYRKAIPFQIDNLTIQMRA